MILRIKKAAETKEPTPRTTEKETILGSRKPLAFDTKRQLEILPPVPARINVTAVSLCRWFLSYHFYFSSAPAKLHTPPQPNLSLSYTDGRGK